MNILRLVCCVVLGASAVAAGQSTWYVDPVCGDDAWTGQREVCAAPDGPKRTIQAAIDAATAASGFRDTVLLGPGVYRGDGNVLIRGSGTLTFRSRSGPADTILDGLGDHGPAFDLEFAAPTIEGLTFRNFRNDSFSGGAISMYGGEPVIRNCVFRDNHAGRDGGAVFSWELSDALMVNCLFEGNSAAGIGGAIFGYGSATAINCTFVDNSAGAGGHAAAWFVELHNCVVRGGPGQLDVARPVSYSNVQGGHVGEGNIDMDPLFVDPDAGDYRLGAGSPSIDAGSSVLVPEGVLTDFDGRERFVDDPATPDTGTGGPGGRAVVDMGAWEFQPSCVADCDGSGDLSIFDFLCYQNLFAAGDPAADLDGDGLLTIFDFLAFQNAFDLGC